MKEYLHFLELACLNYVAECSGCFAGTSNICREKSKKNVSSSNGGVYRGVMSLRAAVCSGLLAISYGSIIPGSRLVIVSGGRLLVGWGNRENVPN